MKFEEFLQDKTSQGGEPSSSPYEPSSSPSWGDEPSSSPEPEEEIEIQKAVVESLAADKVKIEEEASLARERSAALEREKATLAARVAALEGEVASLKAELDRSADRLARNEETPASSKVALLERNVDLDDRFEGETRDHVLEELREARDTAEKEGRNPPAYQADHPVPRRRNLPPPLRNPQANLLAFSHTESQRHRGLFLWGRSPQPPNLSVPLCDPPYLPPSPIIN